MRNNYRSLGEKAPTKVMKVVKIICMVLFWMLFAALVFSAVLSFLKKDGQVSFFGSYLVSIASDSMEPEIMTGSLIINEAPPSAQELKLGDVITYRSPEDSSLLITHRIIEIIPVKTESGIAFRTQGDNAPQADGYYVPYENVLSVYTGTSLNSMGNIVNFFSSYYGVVCMLLVFGTVAVTLYINQNIAFVEYKNELRKDVVAISYGILEMLKDKDMATPDEILDLQQVISLLGTEPDQRKEKDEYSRRLKVFTDRYTAYNAYNCAEYFENPALTGTYEEPDAFVEEPN